MNLYQAFLKSVERHGDRCALLWDEQRMSYRELLALVENVTRYVCHQPEHDPPHVGLVAPNSPNFPIGLFGVLGAGRTVVPWNPLMQAEEIAALSKHAGARLLLFDPAVETLAQAIRSNMGADFQIISVPEAVERGANLSATAVSLPDDESIAMLLYTSGTTGDPKGVMLSHRNLYSNYASYVSVFDFNLHHTFLTALPLFHSYGLTANLLGALLSGACMHLFVQFEPRVLLRSMLAQRRLVLTAVPPMFHFLARRAPQDIAGKHGIEYAVSGGGPLSVEVASLFQDKFGTEVLEGYGLTETSPVVAANRPGVNRLGTIGLPLPEVEVAVRNELGQDLPATHVGELCVRGELVMKGYYRAPEMTAEVLSPSGWLRTGDLATIDQDGYIRIVGRLKDLIVDSGENIYPREIEEILTRHPAVLEAAVVGHPHRVRSEVAHAFVVLDPEVPDHPNDVALRAYARKNLAKFKVPEIFTICTQLPKTATNKVRKEILRQGLTTLE